MSEIDCSQNKTFNASGEEIHHFTVFYHLSLDEFERDLLYLSSDKTDETIVFVLPHFLGVRATKNMKLEYQGHLDNRPETATVVLRESTGKMVLKFKKTKPKKHLEKVLYQVEFPAPKKIISHHANLTSSFEKVRS